MASHASLEKEKINKKETEKEHFLHRARNRCNTFGSCLFFCEFKDICFSTFHFLVEGRVRFLISLQRARIWRIRGRRGNFNARSFALLNPSFCFPVDVREKNVSYRCLNFLCDYPMFHASIEWRCFTAWLDAQVCINIVWNARVSKIEKNAFFGSVKRWGTWKKENYPIDNRSPALPPPSSYVELTAAATNTS